MKVFYLIVGILVGVGLVIILHYNFNILPQPEIYSISTISTVQTTKIKEYRSNIDSMTMVIGRLKATLPIIQVDTIPDVNGFYRIPIMPYSFPCSIGLRINDKEIVHARFTSCVDGYVIDHTILVEDSLIYTKPKSNTWRNVALGSITLAGIVLIVSLLK